MVRFPVAVRYLTFLACTCRLVGISCAEDKTAGLPRIQLADPLSVASGTTTKVKVRGWKLDQTSEVKLKLPGATVKILNKGGAPVPNGQDAKQIGDQQVEVELTIPGDATAGPLELTITTAAGTSEPYLLTLTGNNADQSEVEPNDGFSMAQKLDLPRVVQGHIENDRDVDVFSFQGEKGSTLQAEVFAQRHGSSVDSILTLFDERGNILAIQDDGSTTDAILSVPLPATGLYRLVLQDAHDHGGPAHPYRLQLKLAPANH